MIVTRGKNKALQIDIPAQKSPTGKRIRRSANTTDMERAKQIEAKLLNSFKGESSMSSHSNHDKITSLKQSQQQVSLSLLMTAVRIVREEVNSQLPAQTLEIFLALVLAGGESKMKDLRIQTGLTQPSMTRNIQALGKKNRKGEAGYDLVESRRDPTCDSRKIITLTPKGLNLSNILYGVMRVNNLVNT